MSPPVTLATTSWLSENRTIANGALARSSEYGSYPLAIRACIVLAGGAARRLGGMDKAALRVGEATLLDSVIAAAEPLCERLVVVGPVRPTAAPGVLFTIENEPGGGPVPALVAGLAEAGGATEVFVLAADLPFLSTGGLEQLLIALQESGAGAAAAPDEAGNPNPLLAVYRSEVLHAAAEGLGDSRVGAPASRLLPAGTVVIQLDPDETLNVNTPDDLTAAISILRRRGG